MATTRDQTAEIARTVAVAVNVTTNHHLVEDRPAIPLGIERKAGQLNGRGEGHFSSLEPCRMGLKGWRAEPVGL